MKNLYYIEYPHNFFLKVGEFPSYFDRFYSWQRLNLAVVRRRNANRCPRLW
jgi:hypothetical protein